MQILLNGKKKEIPNNTQLKEIIEQFCRNTKRVIAEVNGDIVKRHLWEECLIHPGDTIELVNLVGGG